MVKKKNNKKKNLTLEERLIAKIPKKVRIKGGRAKHKNKYGTVESSYKDLEVGE